MFRFWKQVDKSGKCWTWTGALTYNGYGRFTIGGATIRAHRFAYELCRGEITNGLNVCHTCDNPKCVRPDHLFLGTIADNHADRNVKGRQARGPRNGSSRLSDAQVRSMRAFDGIFTRAELARMFGVSWNCVDRALRGLTYGDAPVPDTLRRSSDAH